jgi:hypothetical protein
MTRLELDDATATKLAAHARACGMPLAEYLRAIADEIVELHAKGQAAADDFDAALDELFAHDVEPLPPSTSSHSRIEIYSDHD